MLSPVFLSVFPISSTVIRGSSDAAGFWGAIHQSLHLVL
jgi:hypothetical protein